VRLLAWCTALLCLAAGSDVATADPCDGFPPPTNFTVVVGPTPDQSSTGVDITWTPASTSFAGSVANANAMFDRYDVQRRDDTAQGDFVSMSEGNANVQHFQFNGMKVRTTFFYFNLVEKPEVQPCISPWASCVKPGRTYTYRVVTKFKYLAGCALFDGGRIYDSAPTPEVTVTIPGTLVVEGAPEDVRAVAHPTRKQVKVTWKMTEDAEGDGFVVERRKIPRDTTAKAESIFEPIALVGMQDGLLLDKEIETNEEYEYRVAILVAAVTRLGKSDRAYVPGKCASSDFDIWEVGSEIWNFEALKLAMNLQGGLGGIMSAELISTGASDPRWSTQTIASSRGGIAMEGSPSVSFRMDALYPQGVFGALKPGARGKLRVEIDDDPFDPLAYLGATATVQFGHSLLQDHAKVPFGTYDHLQTTVCGSVAASKLKSETVKVGQVVTFVFRAVALGPNALLANRLKIEASLDGGVFAEVGTSGKKHLVRRLDGGTGEAWASFEVGAVGPVTRWKSEEIVLVLRAAATSVPEDGQLRLHVKLVPVEGAVAGQPPFALNLPKTEYVSEVLVAGPPLTKR
jgi:hypothetical protein